MAKNFGVAKKIQNGTEILTRYHYVHISPVAKNHKVSCTGPEANGIVAVSDDVYVPLTDVIRINDLKAKSYYNYGFWYVNPKKTDSFLPGQKPGSTRGSSLPIGTHERLMGGDIYFIPMKLGTTELDFENKVPMRNIDELAIIAGARSFPRQHVLSSNGKVGGVRNTTKVTVKATVVSHDERLRLETRLETLVGLAVSGVVTPEIEKQIESLGNELRLKGDSQFVDSLYARIHSGIDDDTVTLPQITPSFSEPELIPEVKTEVVVIPPKIVSSNQASSPALDDVAALNLIRAAIEAQTDEVPTKKSKKFKVGVAV